MNRVLGIDVGFAICGWSIVEKDQQISNKLRLVGYGAITTKSSTSDEGRLLILFDELEKIIDEYQPTSMAVESVFFFKNQKTVIKVGQARGVIMLTASRKGIPVFDYTPLQVKTAVTGYGRADKKQIQKMVKVIYNLETEPKPDDVADAIAVGTCHLNTF